MEKLNIQDVPLAGYLECSNVIDFEAVPVATLGENLKLRYPAPLAYAEATYNFVRDQIGHSADIAHPGKVTCKASDVLQYGEGICYAKSHLLAALLRYNGIMCGFCYQVLLQTQDSDKLCLHGLNGVYFKDLGRWVRLDARGNTKPGVEAAFSLDEEKLAFAVDETRGERDIPVVFARPAPTVIQTLTANQTFPALWLNLPVDV